MSVWNPRFALGMVAPLLVGLLVFAAIVLPGHELSYVRFAVGAASFWGTAFGLSAMANRLVSRALPPLNGRR